MYVLITNNSRFQDFAHPDCELVMVQGTGQAVLEKGRDLVHQGYHLLNGPLYGNFRPYHQPFRTLLLTKGDGVDAYSLDLIEGAVAMYRDCQWPHVTPENCDPHFVEDYRFIDRELMLETLRAHNLLPR